MAVAGVGSEIGERAPGIGRLLVMADSAVFFGLISPSVRASTDFGGLPVAVGPAASGRVLLPQLTSLILVVVLMYFPHCYFERRNPTQSFVQRLVLAATSGLVMAIPALFVPLISRWSRTIDGASITISSASFHAVLFAFLFGTAASLLGRQAGSTQVTRFSPMVAEVASGLRAATFHLAAIDVVSSIGLVIRAATKGFSGRRSCWCRACTAARASMRSQPSTTGPSVGRPSAKTRASVFTCWRPCSQTAGCASWHSSLSFGLEFAAPPSSPGPGPPGPGRPCPVRICC